MSLLRAPIRCEVKELHEIAVYIHIVCYLQSRVRVTYAGRLEQPPVAHDGRLSAHR